MAYFFYSEYSKKWPTNPDVQRDFEEALGINTAKDALYKIQIPTDKKYEDYNPLEKFIYNFSNAKDRK